MGARSRRVVLRHFKRHMCRLKSVPHTRGNDAALAHASAEGQAPGEQAPGRRRAE